MEAQRIQNMTYFWLATILLVSALALVLLPESLKSDLMAFGSAWGQWWYYVVDGGYVVLLLVGLWLMQKARGQW